MGGNAQVWRYSTCCTPALTPSRLVYVAVSIKVEACGVPYYHVRQHTAHVRTNPSHVRPSERRTDQCGHGHGDGEHSQDDGFKSVTPGLKLSSPYPTIRA